MNSSDVGPEPGPGTLGTLGSYAVGSMRRPD